MSKTSLPHLTRVRRVAAVVACLAIGVGVAVWHAPRGRPSPEAGPEPPPERAPILTDERALEAAATPAEPRPAADVASAPGSEPRHPHQRLSALEIIDSEDGPLVVVDEHGLELREVTAQAFGPLDPLAPAESLEADRIVLLADGRTQHRMRGIEQALESLPDALYAVDVRAVSRSRGDGAERATARWLYFQVEGPTATRISAERFTAEMSPTIASTDRFGRPTTVTSMGWSPSTAEDERAPASFAVRIPDTPENVSPPAEDVEREEP